jgi:formylglycine-generating enzyme required for sulfatase activity
VKANALALTGYRLPAEAEWELACRAGSVTPWSMGEAEDLLDKYAWSIANSSSRMRPAGSLRPNDLGLFDLHGNAWEWCNNGYQEFTHDRNIDDRVNDTSYERPLRGGAFNDGPLILRSTLRTRRGARDGRVNHGFRPARTFR